MGLNLICLTNKYVYICHMPQKQKFIVLVTWLKTGIIEPYNNVKAFTKKFPAYSYSTISNYLSRRGEPFTDETVKVERKEIIL